MLPRTPPSLIALIVLRYRRRNVAMRAKGDGARRVAAAARMMCGVHPGLDPADLKARAERAKALAKAVRAAHEMQKTPDDRLVADTLSIAEIGLIGERMNGDLQDAADRELATMGKQLHVASFVDGIIGFSPLGLAKIIGEAGDLSNYANPAKLWKRMGLGLIGSGERQQRFSDAAKAQEAGYSPVRRSVMWNIGDVIVKCQVRKDQADPEKRISLGELGQIYLDRKAYELARGQKLIVAHRRAQRYMEKRLLRNLWRAWRGQAGDAPVTG